MLSKTELIELANLLYPDVTEMMEDLENRFPPRDLPENAMVTRFAPSPTGYVHIGGIYASLISRLLAHQSQGVFYLRIEDTDQRREIEGGTEGIIATMQQFGVVADEGCSSDGREVGAYGPYMQSHRKAIYDVCAKWLVAHGHAYPCFCTEAELETIHQEQVTQGLLKKGYYGKWAKFRDASIATVKDQLAKGDGFVLRVRAPEEPGKVRFTDLVRGKVEVDANATDMVLIKSNGLPTYHFAHVVDDHFMRTTHVTRGEEWLSTAPLHVQLFEMFGFDKLTYIHFSHIGKTEGSGVRKLSKRKDPEAAMSLYTEQGYHPIAVLEYLLNLANSGFSDWRRANPDKSYTEFPFDARKIGKSIAIFDQKKLEDISRDVIAKLTEQEVYDAVVSWAEQYNLDFANRLKADTNYSRQIFAIERHQERPRKDIVRWSDVPELVWYFFDDLFAERGAFFLPDGVTTDDARQILQYFIDHYRVEDDKDAWSDKCRGIAEKLGYARDVKTFKQTPEKFKGHVGHSMAILRIALTGEKNTPDLFQVMQVLGESRVKYRLQSALALL